MFLPAIIIAAKADRALWAARSAPVPLLPLALNVVVEVAPEVEGVLEVVSEVLASAATPQFGSDLCQCLCLAI